MTPEQDADITTLSTDDLTTRIEAGEAAKAELERRGRRKSGRSVRRWLMCFGPRGRMKPRVISKTVSGPTWSLPSWPALNSKTRMKNNPYLMNFVAGVVLGLTGFATLAIFVSII